MFRESTSTCWHQKFIFNCHTIKTVGVPSIHHRFHTADDAITLDGKILLYDPLSSCFGHTMLLWFLAAGGDGHRLIFGGCDEVGAYMELTLWHNTAHAESFQFYLSDYPCPGYAE